MTSVAELLSSTTGVAGGAMQRLGPTVRRHGAKEQGAIFATAAKVAGKRLAGRFTGHPEPATMKLLDYTVTAPSTWDLMYLFTNVFVRQEYYFETPSKRPFIVDCGGNIGMATLYFKWLYPEADVITFEPDPLIFGLLEQNIRGNDVPGVQLENAALFEVEGPLDFFVDRTAAGGLINSVNPLRGESEKLTVPGVRLSSYLDREVDFLKVDVEGAEHQVMRELETSGALSGVKQLVMEYHHHIAAGEDRLGEMLGIMERAGFGYQIEAVKGPADPELFQDIMIVAYNKKLAS